MATSDFTRRRSRSTETTKRDLYARHSIAEYRVVDLNSNTMTVYQNAVDNRYQYTTVYGRGESFDSPVLQSSIGVSDCFGGK